MNVLILTATAGEGHNSVARSLHQEFTDSGHTCRVIDICDINSELLKDLVNYVYNWSIHYTPGIYGALYNTGARKTKESHYLSLIKITQRTLSYEIKKVLKDETFDVMIATHPYAACMVDDYKKDQLTDAVTVGIVTDFTVHPLWEDTRELDYYVVAHKDLKSQLARKKLATDAMLDFGIPIHKKFFAKKDPKKAREKLELDENLPIVLLLSGSMDRVAVDRVVKRLDYLPNEFQLVVLLGKSKARLEKLRAIQDSLKHSMIIRGFAPNIEDYYDAADVMITKPGGLTTSEAIAKGLPMILTDPIPGQEKRNVEFFMNHQLALYATDTFPDVEALEIFFDNDHVRNTLVENMKYHYKDDPTQKLREFLEKKVHPSKGENS